MPVKEGDVLLAFTIALIGTSAFLPVAWWGLKRWTVLDHPNERSSHARPTPRGGGLAQIVGAVAALGVLAPPVGAVVGVLSFGTLGAVDDFRSLSVRFRLAAQVGISGVVGILLWPTESPFSLWILLASVVVLPLTVNAVNFMDGINGLSALHGVVLGGVYWTLLNQFNPNWAPVAAALVGISAAFLPWNWRKQAKLFLGDSGSYLLGALLAFLSVHLWVSSGSVLIALAPLSVYVADVLLTLAKRVARRAPLMTPHREHVYQQLVDLGISQTYVSALVAFLSALAGLLAICAARQNLPVMVTTGALTVIVLAYLVLPKCGLRLLR